MLVTTDPEVAAAALAAGRLAALPTETVYGLGARADLAAAVARVYAAKGRPADHPLIVHVPDAAAVTSWARRLPPYAEALGDAFWPGPLTLVLDRSARAASFLTGGQDTVAVRVPSHPVMREVLRLLAERVGDPAAGVAAPSANRFGRVSPTAAGHVLAELGEVLAADDVVLDGGASAVGVESTIVDCTGPAPVILRPGGVSQAEVEAVCEMACGAASAVRAPGTLASHYAPRARVRLVTAQEVEGFPARRASAQSALLAPVEVATPPGMIRLAAPGSADQYAQILYAALREADDLGVDEVLAVPPAADGIGAAVRDRLGRAAH